MSWRYEGGDANEAILIMLMWCGPGIGGTRGPWDGGGGRALDWFVWDGMGGAQPSAFVTIHRHLTFVLNWVMQATGQQWWR